MKPVTFSKAALFAIMVVLTASASMSAMAQKAMNVNYGRIVEIGKQEKSTSGARTGGALLGGAVGLYSGRNKSRSNRALRSLGGAAVGGAVGGRAASGTIPSYTVNLLNGKTVRIVIESTSFRLNDCVAVETGNSNNLRRVSDQYCIADVPQEFKEEHKREANECDQAKQGVLDAKTESEIKAAAMRMDILCQD